MNRPPIGLFSRYLFKIEYITGGKYFRATSADLLSTIYGNLSGIEASDSGDHYYTPTEELYWIPLLAALLLGFLTAVLIRWHHG